MAGFDWYSAFVPEINPRTLQLTPNNSRMMKSHQDTMFPMSDDVSQHGGMFEYDPEFGDPKVSGVDRFMGLTADFSPAGIAKGIEDAYTGEDSITGEHLPGWARALAMAGILPLSKMPKYVKGSTDEVLRIAKSLLEDAPNAKPSLLKQVLPKRLANSGVDLQQVLSGKITPQALENYNTEMGRWTSNMQNIVGENQDVAFLNIDPELLPPEELEMLTKLNESTHGFKFDQLNSYPPLNDFSDDDYFFDGITVPDEVFDNTYNAVFSPEIKTGMVNDLERYLKHVDDAAQGNIRANPYDYNFEYLDPRDAANILEEYNQHKAAAATAGEVMPLGDYLDESIDAMIDDFVDSGHLSDHPIMGFMTRTATKNGLPADVEHYMPGGDLHADHVLTQQGGAESGMLEPGDYPTATNIGWSRMNDMGDDLFIGEMQTDLAHFKPENPIRDAIKTELKEYQDGIQSVLGRDAESIFDEIIDTYGEINEDAIDDAIEVLGPQRIQELSNAYSIKDPIDLRKSSSTVGQLAKNWEEIQLENILGHARDNQYKRILLNSPEGVLAQGGGPGEGTMRSYYEKLPKKFGFEQVTGHPLTHKMEQSVNTLSGKARVLGHRHPEILKAYDDFTKGRGSVDILNDLIDKGYDISSGNEEWGKQVMNLEQLINRLYRQEYPDGLPIWELNLEDALK